MLDERVESFNRDIQHFINDCPNNPHVAKLVELMKGHFADKMVLFKTIDSLNNLIRIQDLHLQQLTTQTQRGN